MDWSLISRDGRDVSCVAAAMSISQLRSDVIQSTSGLIHGLATEFQGRIKLPIPFTKSE